MPERLQSRILGSLVVGAIDNNRSERDQIFRYRVQNRLFSNTCSGVQTCVMLYSLIETAKANGLQTSPYITALFEKLPEIDTVDNLLPWNNRL
jgi:hypothetical protein